MWNKKNWGYLDIKIIYRVGQKLLPHFITNILFVYIHIAQIGPVKFMCIPKTNRKILFFRVYQLSTKLSSACL